MRKERDNRGKGKKIIGVKDDKACVRMGRMEGAEE